MSEEKLETPQDDPEWVRIKKQMMMGTGGAGALGGGFGFLTHGPTGMGVAALITAGLLYIQAKEQPDAFEWVGRKMPFLRRERKLARLTKRMLRRDQAAQIAAQPLDAPHVDVIDGGAQPVVAAKNQGPVVAPGSALPGPCTLSDALATGWRPSLDQILLGYRQDGSPILVAAKDLCHMAVSGPTGQGKSSNVRLVEAQLCYAGADVLHLDPHWCDYDIDQNEDWTPYKRKYIQDPVAGAQFEVIEYYLCQIATELIDKRLAKRRVGQPTGNKLFVVLDELPIIMKKVAGAQDYLERILREGRKVGIYLLSSSQDFLVKTLFPNGGGEVRDCYRTVFYTGGNNTSGRTLLDLTSKDMPEEQLGQGVVMLRCKGQPQATLTRVPYLDNNGLYTLLGPSTWNRHLATAGISQTGNLVRFGQPEREAPVEREPRYRPPQDHRVRVGRQFHPRQEGTPVKQPPTHTREVAAREPEVHEDLLLQRGIAVYREGATAIADFAAAMDMKMTSARLLLARVKQALKVG